MDPMASRIKKHMQRSGLTIPGLARRSGVTADAIRKILRENRSPQSTTIRKLAKGLGIKPSELID